MRSTHVLAADADHISFRDPSLAIGLIVLVLVVVGVVFFVRKRLSH